MAHGLDVDARNSSGRPEAGGLIRLAAAPRFGVAPTIEERPAGQTLADLAREVLPPRLWPFAAVLIDDQAIDRAVWHLCRPKPGRLVTVCVRPAGGGEGGGKTALRVVLMIAIVAASLFIPGAIGLTGFAAAALSAGISVVGSLAVNMLIPPPQAKMDKLSGTGDQQSQALAISGPSNQPSPYGIVPKLYGQLRYYPKKAARDWTESGGGATYVRSVFDFGVGPVKISGLRIGAVPIEQFEGVDVEIREGWPDDPPLTLYPETVIEDVYQVRLPEPGSQTVQTRDDADEASVDISLPYGLYRIENSPPGKINSFSVGITAGYRLLPDGGWVTFWSEVITAKSTTPLRFERRVVFPARGRYEISVSRTSWPSSNQHYDETWLTALRTIRNEPPIRVAGHALVALRIRASDQLNGQINDFSAVAEAMVRRPMDLGPWGGGTLTSGDVTTLGGRVDGATGWAWVPSRTPEWAVWDALTGPYFSEAIAESQIDIDSFVVAALESEAEVSPGDPKWTFDAAIDFETALYDLCRDICASARARFLLQDGRYQIVRDRPGQPAVQVFTPRNSWGFSGAKTFTTELNALRMRWNDVAGDAPVQAETLVYADGEDAASATAIESVEMFGCTRSTQAWREGRYHMAQARLRPEVFSLQVDAEYLECRVGSVVVVNHDVARWGLGSARIMAVFRDGGNRVTGVELDAPMPLIEGQAYALGVRTPEPAGAPYAVHPITATATGETATLTFDALAPLDREPAIGDLAVFGEADRESVRLLVKAIFPGPDWTARLQMVDEAPAVHLADQGEIPPYDPQISRPPVLQPRAPAEPLIREVIADARALIVGADGRSRPRILILLDAGAGDVPTAAYEGQSRWRDAEGGDGPWRGGPMAPVAAGELAIDAVTDGETYDVRVRAVSAAGLASAWAQAPDVYVTGRLAPPGDVPGFTAARRADGVQLTWQAVSELDLLGYEIRDGEPWEAATVVTARHRGTSLFVALADATPHVFLIRAIDELGQYSARVGRVAATVAAPGAVTGFAVAAQGEWIQARWTPFVAAVEVEVRAGAGWETGAVVGRTAGASLVALWPVSAATVATFWAKAIAASGLASANAAFATVNLTPPIARNVIVSRDQVALGWPGLRHYVEIDGSDRMLSIVGRYGEYAVGIDLGAPLRARSWIEIAEVMQIWDTLSWDTAGALTWVAATRTWALTAPVDGRQTIAALMLPLAEADLPAALVEGFALAGALTGLRGTAPSSSSAIAYADGRYRDGLDLAPTTAAAWTLTATAASWRVRATLRPADHDHDATYLTLTAGASSLSLGWDAFAGKFVLDDGTDQVWCLQNDWLEGDVVEVLIEQTATQRRLIVLHAGTGSYQDTPEALASPGSLTVIAVPAQAGFGGPGSRGVLADLAVWSGATTPQDFAAEALAGPPLGCTAFGVTSPRDDLYQSAVLVLRLPALHGDRVAVEGCVFNADVPDRRLVGALSVATGGASIVFDPPFSAAPVLSLTVAAATAWAVPEIVSVTASGATVKLYAPGVPGYVAGTLNWVADGY